MFNAGHCESPMIAPSALLMLFANSARAAPRIGTEHRTLPDLEINLGDGSAFKVRRAATALPTFQSFHLTASVHGPTLPNEGYRESFQKSQGNTLSVFNSTLTSSFTSSS
jgi:hypothetical protein